MGKIYESVIPELAPWHGRQRLFFVATEPSPQVGM